MTYFSTDVGSQIHDITDDYYLYQDKSLHSALVIERHAELTTIDPNNTTLELEWEQVFHTTHYVLNLKQQALKGQLRSSSFRSIVWQVLLEVLPGDLRTWGTVSSANRQVYADLKARYEVDPHQNEDMSVTVNNPLSQEEQNPWARFFQDNELRKVIMQDIKRTYPGELMFEQHEIRDMMLSILFIYAREYPDISYKQGMHELLAPLVYVFYNEYTLVHDVAAPSSVAIRSLLSLDYLEHDIYHCYLKLMTHTRSYYKTDKVIKDDGSERTDQPVQLFIDTPHQPPTYTVQRLEELQNVTLKRFDPELQQHLQKLSIQPQLYGLRWMRLLFGREFPLKDMLVIWDALFASPDFSGMVEYVCIAMLLYIRDALLCNDHTGCLVLLMKYPESKNVLLFVQRALYLRNPSHYECPPNVQYNPHKGRTSNSTSSGGSDRQHHVTRSRSRDMSPRVEISKPNPVAAISESLKRRMSAPKTAPIPASSNNPPKPAESSDNDSDEFAEWKRVQKYCSDRLDTLLDELQATICDLCDQESENEDRLLEPLAGLKQVRDVLKGNVSLGCILGPSESETPSAISSSENGDLPPDTVSSTFVKVDQDDTSSQGPSSLQGATSRSSVQVPPPPPADLETLDLFNDFSLSSKQRPSTSSKRDTDQATKSQDFFDPLSSALKQKESLDAIPEFLK